THMRPPTTIARRVRVAGTISVRMVYAMRHHPLNRPALERQRAARRKKVFNWFWNFITAMGQQPVISHADTETSRDPVKHHCGNQRRPAPEKERCDCCKMCKDQENSICPINPKFLFRPVYF